MVLELALFSFILAGVLTANEISMLIGLIDCLYLGGILRILEVQSPLIWWG